MAQGVAQKTLPDLCPRIGCAVPLFMKQNPRTDRSDYPACRRYKAGLCAWTGLRIMFKGKASWFRGELFDIGAAYDQGRFPSLLRRKKTHSPRSLDCSSKTSTRRTRARRGQAATSTRALSSSSSSTRQHSSNPRLEQHSYACCCCCCTAAAYCSSSTRAHEHGLEQREVEQHAYCRNYGEKREEQNLCS